MNTSDHWRRLLWIGAFSNNTHDYNNDFAHCFHLPFKEACSFLLNREKVHAIIITMLLKPAEILEIKRIADHSDTPLLIYTPSFDQTAKELTMALGIDDYCFGSFRSSLMLRIDFIKRIKLYKRENHFKLRKAGFRLKTEVIIPAVKRAFDIIVGVSLILLLSPLLIFMALIIRLGSKGSILETNRRVGLGFKTFKLYEFKASKNEIEPNNTIWFSYVNKFFLSTGLNQLPALINVVKGDMTFIGSDPWSPSDARTLTADKEAQLLKKNIGITGLWKSRVPISPSTTSLGLS